MTIRPATLSDVPNLHRLVAELADYVGERHMFTATIEEYETDFKEGFYEAIVAEVDGKVVGQALYYYVYSTWKGRMVYLEDFVLDSAYRRKGIGQKLWDALIETGKAKGCKLMKWQVVDTNKGAMKFYLAQEGTKIEEQWLDGKLYF